MRCAKGRVDAAENDFRVRLQFLDGFDNFAHAKIPVGHHRLDQHNIEPLFGQQTPEIFAGAPKSVKTSRNIRQSRRLDDRLSVEPASAKGVSSARHKMVEYGQFAFAEPSSDTKKPVWTQPEVKGCEVVYGRINKEQVHLLNVTMRSLLGGGALQ